MIFQLITRRVSMLRINRSVNHSMNFSSNYDAAELKDRYCSAFANDDYRNGSWTCLFEKSECWHGFKTLSTMSH